MMDDNHLTKENSPRSKPYDRLKGLDDPEQAAEYLKVVLEEGANNINLYSSSGDL
jgi:DNA-binding phage protein